MGISVSRIASHFGPRLQPLFQTSRASSRQFTYGPVPLNRSPLATRLANSLPKTSAVKPKYNFNGPVSGSPIVTSLPKISAVKLNHNFRNTTTITSDNSYLSSLAAAIVSCIAYWFFSTNVSSASAQESSEITDIRAQDLKAIAQKQGQLWECYDRKPDEYGGYIYYYKLRKEFDSDTLELLGYDHTEDADGDDELDRVEGVSYEKQSQIFPAVEPQNFDDLSDVVEIVSQGRFKKLGYSFKQDKTGVYLCIPDKEALEARFEKIRKLYTGLKPLKILSIEGTSDDLAFIKAYLEYDFLLGEFIHDHFAHALPTLHLMLSFPEEYALERDRLRGNVGTVLNRIILAEQMIEKGHLNDLKNELPKIKTAVGIAVDTLWAISTIDEMENAATDSFENELFEIMENSDFREYWEKKFGEKFDREAFANHWKQLVNFEEVSTTEPKIQAVDKRTNS